MKRFRLRAVVAVSRRYAVALGLPFFMCMVLRGVANGNEINVDNRTDIPIPGLCTLRQAILSHNTKSKPAFSGCTAGSGSDFITLPEGTIDLGDPLEVQNGSVHFLNNHSHCSNWRQAAYLTIDKGAEVILEGVGIVPNGSHKRSIIENNGGNLTIQSFSASDICRFSNEQQGDDIPVNGGILINRDNGTTTISGGNFVNSRVTDSGGAIEIASGTVRITDSVTSFPTTFAGNSAGEELITGSGGAIDVSIEATLTIDSNNFLFQNNQSNAGGAIDSRGTVTIKRGSSPLNSIYFKNNNAVFGGAISIDGSFGANFSIDGIGFVGNKAVQVGGGVGVFKFSNEFSNNPVTISRTSFLANNARNGGAVGVGQTALTVNASTFEFDTANQGASIYDASASNLKILNSTFLGSDKHEGIALTTGSAKIGNSTIVSADLGIPPARRQSSQGQIELSNSILSDVTCTASVLDEGINLQFQSRACPSSIPASNPLLDPRSIQDNGGLTGTIALLQGSPAIDQIPIGDCLDLDGKPLRVDQRGFGRPFPPGGSCDIGAYEFGASAVGRSCNGNGVTVLPATVDFGRIKAGQSSAPIDVSMINCTGEELSISGTSIGVDFKVVNSTCPSSLDPDQACDFFIAFEPQRTGTKNEVFRVFNSARSGSAQKVRLSGIATRR